jgi:hypothetical protein
MVTAVLEGGIENYFYNEKVDKASDAIQKILTRMDLMKQSAFSELSVQQMEFFNNARLALQNFQSIYADSLDQTVAKIGKEASIQLSQIDTMVHTWTNSVLNPDASKTAQQLQGLFSNCLLIKDHPKVIAFHPTFVAPMQRENYVLIECVGAFPPVLSPDMEPKLVTQNNTFPVTDSAHGFIRFAVPFHVLFPEGEQPITDIRTASYSVHIPYIQKGYIFNRTVEQTYKGSIVLLPESPGKIVVKSAQVNKMTEEETITSPTFRQESRPRGLNATEIDHPYTLQTKPGWEIVPGSSKFLVVENKGRRQTSSWRLGKETPSFATWRVSTRKYRPVDHCDKVIFKISAVVRRDIQTVTPSETEHSLKWGDTIQLGSLGDDFSVTLHNFDGTTHTLVGTTFGKYMDLKIHNGQATLAVKSPDQISSFNVQNMRSSAG